MGSTYVDVGATYVGVSLVLVVASSVSSLNHHVI